MIGHFLSNGFLEAVALLESHAVCLCDDWYDVDDVGQLLHDDDIDRLETVSRWSNEVQAAVNTRVFDMTIAHSRELLAKILRVLVLVVFNDWVPFPFIVNLVAEAWRVDNSQIELDVILLYACEAYTVSAVVVVNVAHGYRDCARARKGLSIHSTIETAATHGAG